MKEREYRVLFKPKMVKKYWGGGGGGSYLIKEKSVPE